MSTVPTPIKREPCVGLQQGVHDRCEFRSSSPTITTPILETDAGGNFAALYRKGRANWPDLDIEFYDFVRYVQVILQRSELSAVTEHATDLYLACGCLEGSTVALRTFVRQYVEPLLTVTGALRQREDLRQIVLERLLSAKDGSPPRLSEYSGRSTLRTWLKVVIKRCSLNLERNRVNGERQSANDQLEDKLVSVGNDPELDYLKLRYAHEFKRAFRVALQQLDARDTLVLKMHVCEGARTGEIAQFFGVNRVTVTRWMADIRQGLLRSTQRHLERELRLSRAEFESIVRLVITSLNLTLSCLNEPSMA